MMTKATWDIDMQAVEWKSTVKNGPTLDEAVAQYYRWSSNHDDLYDLLRYDTMQYIKENYMEEALEKYPELMI